MSHFGRSVFDHDVTSFSTVVLFDAAIISPEVKEGACAEYDHHDFQGH
jgi:hypothetical protein